MLTSLKALLFSSAPMPTLDSAKAAVLPEGMDFAAMLDAGVADMPTAPTASTEGPAPETPEAASAPATTLADEPSTAQRLIDAQALHMPVPASPTPQQRVENPVAAPDVAPKQAQPVAVSDDRPVVAATPEAAQSDMAVAHGDSQEIDPAALPQAAPTHAPDTPLHEPAPTPLAAAQTPVPASDAVPVADVKPSLVQPEAAEQAVPAADAPRAASEPLTVPVAPVPVVTAAPPAPAAAAEEDVAAVPPSPVPAPAKPAIRHAAADPVQPTGTPALADETETAAIAPDADKSIADEDSDYIAPAPASADPLVATLSTAMPIAPEAAPASTTVQPSPSVEAPAPDAPAPAARPVTVADGAVAMPAAPAPADAVLPTATPIAPEAAPAPVAVQPSPAIAAPAIASVETVDVPPSSTPMAQPEPMTLAAQPLSPPSTTPAGSAPTAQVDPAPIFDAASAAPVALSDTIVVPTPVGMTAQRPVAADGMAVRPPVARDPSMAVPANDMIPATTATAAIEAAPSIATPAASVAVVTDEPTADALPTDITAPIDQPADPVAAARQPRSEALSLLQLARDYLRGGPVREDKVNAPAGKTAIHDTVAPPLSAQTPTTADSAQPSIQPAVQTIAPQPTVTTLPTVDLSASLSSQVVDMGVTGQWIDGLARDIAGLSANGAQGRFEVNTGQLGAVQVDIRQGAEGASISLTVATEAAEQALRQDSDRLRLDAGLSALRIADVKVERAPVAEAARTDSAGQQSSSHQQSSSQQQPGNNWQGTGSFAGQFGGQSAGHYQGQGRWQGRENSGADAKAGGDAAVLNHVEGREMGGDAVRARYA